MNTLETKIQEALTLAIKSKDTIRVSALRSIKAAITEAKTAANGKKELEDSDIVKIIQKLAKQREESAAIYKEHSRVDLANNELAELNVLNDFLPKKLTEDELIAVIERYIKELNATTIKDMGKVIGVINKEYMGKVDGSVVAKLVKSKLS